MVCMFQLSSFLWLVTLFFTAEANTCNVTGTWQNDLGSILKLSVDQGMFIEGSFHTMVETSKGSAGSTKASKVIGFQNVGDEPTFVFSVCWHGGSVSTWAGQCFGQADHAQVLKTIWLLRSSVSSIEKNWKATRIGEDIFYLMKKP
ncbi:avidin-related protein 4/5 [Microcaecilia unicolor]|uniref:Avidin-related protein 4/5-like n=1 Tax=Microcaecilia unicolor TaxID=1415580 RepID=A0A6P7Y4T6_9AMPH|nr:avidin-related protein 4/5-like [Microcaecilia unicolor]